jgi:uncharacterized membrane protein
LIKPLENTVPTCDDDKFSDTSMAERCPARRRGTGTLNMRTALRILLAAIYLVAGIAHIRAPTGFVRITPAWVPSPETVVLVTGLCEIAGAVALALIPSLRRAAGVALAVYAVCVFPANINHAVNDIAIGGVAMSWWYHGPRLLFQPVAIWWALWAGDVIDWPFAQRSKA